MSSEDTFIVDESDQSTISEFDDELGEIQHDYANPVKVMERAKKLESIPFELVKCQAPSPVAQKRIDWLEAQMRKPGPFPGVKYIGTQFYLESSFLQNPLVEGWPSPEGEESDIEYSLHETEEDWFAWKREADLIRARKALRYPGNEETFSGTSPPFSRYGTPSSEISPLEGSISRSVSFVTVFDDSKSPVGKLTLAVDWNQPSLEAADSSTPPQPPIHLMLPTALSQPSTPPRQLASPPDSGFQPPEVLPMNTQTPSRPSGTSQASILFSSQPAISPVTHITRISQETGNSLGPCTPPISSQTQFTPPTPLSPEMQSHNQISLSQFTSPSPSTNSVSARASHSKRNRPKAPSQSSRQTTPRNDLHPQRRPSKSNLQVSPATTYFLYGSQTERSPIVYSKPENQGDAYGQELEREGMLIDRQRSKSSESIQGRDRRSTDGRAISTHGTSVNGGAKDIDRWSRGLWDINEDQEEDVVQYVSQEAKEISEYIGNDLGDFYRDGAYDALGKLPSPAAYFDPYSLVG